MVIKVFCKLFRYIIPTKYFFDKISENWGQMQLEAEIKKLNDK